MIVRRGHLTFLREGEAFYPLPPGASLDNLLQLSVADLRSFLESLDRSRALTKLLPGKPIESQEVWAAGVTYERSREARMAEAVSADPYERVYDAERPEIFLKATPDRVRGPGEPIAIRSDSTWDVPEPELALVCNSRLEIAGYTIGNDVSSRSIEGENPLYLPQAKVYDGCCSLGPGIVPAWELDARSCRIELVIERDGAEVFRDETSTARLHRSPAELVAYLGRHQVFDRGVILLTGTGIVPPEEFTLQDRDVVTISIDGIGSLRNPVVKLAASAP